MQLNPEVRIEISVDSGSAGGIPKKAGQRKSEKKDPEKESGLSVIKRDFDWDAFEDEG